MKQLNIIAILTGLMFLALICSADPNTPIVAPLPGQEVITKIDSDTIRVTTSVYIKKGPLLRKRTALINQIEALQVKLVKINKKLKHYE